MSRSEIAIIVILRLIGVMMLFAIPAMFLPHSWMARIHEALDLGTMPSGPIVDYLTHSLSGFYAAAGAFLVYVSLDIRRYRSLVTFSAVMFALYGVAMLAIDLHAGMPISWTAWEGPPAIVTGGLMGWLNTQGRDTQTLRTQVHHQEDPHTESPPVQEGG